MRLPPARWPGRGCANCSMRSPTATCVSAVRFFATRRTRDFPTSCGENSTARSRRGSRRKWIIRRRQRASSRCITSKPASTSPRGDTPPRGKACGGVYAYVEAAGLYARALEAGRQLPDLGAEELARVHQAIGDAWYRAGEFSNASAAIRRPVRWSRAIRSWMPSSAQVSHLEDKLGNYAEALRWTEQARDTAARTVWPGSRAPGGTGERLARHDPSVPGAKHGSDRVGREHP